MVSWAYGAPTTADHSQEPLTHGLAKRANRLDAIPAAVDFLVARLCQGG